VKPRRRAFLVALLVWAGAAPAQLCAQYVPPTTGGIVRLDELLQRLGEPRRVLMIGAHPDDEDTDLLTVITRGVGAEVGYLSLSRGEGGQNLIGPELGVGLGLIRTGELEAARSVDGGRQFFTRAYDFGYSKSLDEAMRLWTPDSILKDVVRIIRRFQPHAIVSVWSGTSRDGHGQHQMAGVVAAQAFTAAGDPERFPELRSEEQLEPWTPVKLYRSARFDLAAATLTFEAGALDPRNGHSFHQIAMASRSRHRSQDMGALQEIGPHPRGLGLVEDRTRGGDAGLLAGVPIGHPWLGALADSLRATLSPTTMAAAAVPLARALGRAHREGVRPDRIAMLSEAWSIASSLVVDAVASEETVPAGGSLDVTVRVANAGATPIVIRRVELRSPPRWNSDAVDTERSVGGGEAIEIAISVRVADDARVTAPYFLERPLAGALYDWTTVPAPVRGLPFQPELLKVNVRLDASGVPVELSGPVTHRFNDQAVGEQRRAVRVVPLVDVRLEPGALVWVESADSARKTFRAVLRSNSEESVRGVIALEAEGWDLPGGIPFTLQARGEQRSFEFLVPRPRLTGTARSTMRAVARLDDGEAIDFGVEEIVYPHVRRVAWTRPAEAQITLAEIALPAVRRIGYVRGASDRVPEALSEVGLAVELLDREALERGALSDYDVIVIGSRAYETNGDLVRHNGRLLEYVRDGGHLVVQYQQYQFVRGGYAPFPLTIARPHDRVADETAPVRILDSAHPILTRPNRIGGEDWEGWPQERGLYFARTWDDAYHPLLEMADPGEEPLRGSVLAAHYGRGTYIYTGIAFFRGLPAGTPGAYRLFLNMLQPGW